MLPVKALRGDRSNSSISQSLVADSFDEFDLTQDYEQNGKRYNFQSITPEQYNSLSAEDKIKYVDRMDDILSVMKDRNAVGTDNFLKEVSQYYKD